MRRGYPGRRSFLGVLTGSMAGLAGCGQWLSNEGQTETSRDTSTATDDGNGGLQSSGADSQQTPTDPTVKRARNGFVVPIAPGLGPGDAVDPAETATPVADALAAIDAVGDREGYGTVLLPPTEVEEAKPLVPSQFVEFVGWGAHTSEITFTNLERDGFRVTHLTDGKFVLLDAFTISGGDAERRTGGSALHFANDSGVHPKQFNIGNLAFRDWIDPVVHCERGSPFGSSWGHLDFGYDANHGREFLVEREQSLLGTQIGYIDAGNATGDTVFYTDFGGVKANIGFINIGGSAGRAIRIKASSNGHLHVGGINFEPVRSVSGPIVSVQGDASTRLDYVQNTNSEVESMVQLEFNNGNTIIGLLRNNGTVRNAKIEVTKDAAGPSYYFGPSSDVAVSPNATGDIWTFGDMQRYDGEGGSPGPAVDSGLTRYADATSTGLSGGEFAIESGDDGSAALLFKDEEGMVHRWYADETTGS